MSARFPALSLILLLSMTGLPAAGTVASSENSRARSDELVEAAQSGDLPQVELLISKGADVNAHGSPYGEDAAPTDTPLTAAAFSGNTKLVKYLLDHGARVNDRMSGELGTPGKGGTALAEASGRHPAVMKLLIGAGADVQVRTEFGRTAMSSAIEACSIHSVQILMRAGASVKDAPAQKGMRMALSSLGEKTAADICAMVKFLLKAGARPDSRGFEEYGDRSTILMIASGMPYGHEGGRVQSPEIVRLLVQAGANVNLRNELGHTALWAANDCRNKTIARILKQAGGRL